MTTDSAHPSDFGLLLRDLRSDAGLTQEGLALLARISVRAISDLERGINRFPRAHTLRQLADALKLSDKDRNALETAARPRVELPERIEFLRATKVGNFLGARPLTPIVSRRAELESIVMNLDKACENSGRLVLLEGGPGVGKTRLAQEMIVEANARGFIVAPGRCHEGEEDVPFYPFLELLAVLSAECPQSLRDLIPARWPYLSQLLGHTSPSSTSYSDGEQEARSFRSVTDFVRAIASMRPVAISIDDLHWADGTSLRLFLYLARFTRGDRVFLLGTYRDVAVDTSAPLESTLNALVREQLAQTLRVMDLDRESVQRLLVLMLDGEVSDDVTDLIYQTTDGNPFFAREVLRSWIEHGDVYQSGSEWVRSENSDVVIPQSVRQIIRERLSRLNHDVQILLFQACVLGFEFQFNDLAALNGGDEHAVEQALEDAHRMGFVHAIRDDRFAFNHALIHRSLYAELPPRRKRRMHLASAVAIESEVTRTGSARPSELARHFIQGGDRGRAMEFTRQAGDAAQSIFAYQEAAKYFRLSLMLAREMGAASDERRSLERLGTALRGAGYPYEALEVLEEVSLLYRAAGDLHGEARSVAQIADLHRRWGSPSVGIAGIQGLLDRNAEIERSPLLVMLHVILSQLLFATENYEESRIQAQRGINLAHALDHAVVLARAEVRSGAALSMLGETESARSILQGAVARAEVIGDDYTLSDALSNLAAVYVDTGDLEDSRQCIDRVSAIEERWGTTAGLAWAERLRGDLAFYGGDWQTARGHFGRSVELYRAIPGSRFAPYALLSTGSLLIRTGETEEGAGYLHEALAATTENGDQRGARLAGALLAEHDLLEGRPESARLRLEPLHAEAVGNEMLQFLPLLATAYLALGTVQGVEDLLTAAINGAQAHGHWMAMPSLLRVRGTTMASQSRWNEAIHDFSEALSLLEIVAVPYERAVTLYEYGLMERQRGEYRAAYADFKRAVTIFRQLGACPYLERAQEAARILKAQF